MSYLPILNSSSLFRSSISGWMLSWYRLDLVNRSPLPVISPDGRMKHQKPHVKQISPDKSMNFRYTTAAFTISPEPRASLCCANLLGDLAFRLRSLSYGETGVCLASRRPGVALAKTGFRQNLTIPPLPSANIFANISKYQQGSRIGDFHPISSRPCRAYTRRLHLITGAEPP